MNRISLNLEWLPLQKYEFRILVMISDLGGNLGNASDICRYFQCSPQTKTKDKYRAALQSLKDSEAVDFKVNKGKYTASLKKAIPKEKRIDIERKYFTEIIQHNYSQSVAWENVLKVYVYLGNIGEAIFTNREIGEKIGISESTVTEAKNALKELGACIIDRVNILTGGEQFRCIGQIAGLSAFWIAQ